MTKFSVLLVYVAASLASACGGSREASRDDSRPNVLLVTLDTTRPDHLSCYGYRKKTSPYLDALAKDGLRYDNAYAVSSWTLPSHASIFTGMFPTSHGARYDPEGNINLVMEGGIRAKETWDKYRANTIARDEETLAELLGQNGYVTQGIIGGPWLKKVFGLGQGFGGYDDSAFEFANGSEVNGRTAQSITDAAIGFVDEHTDEPFFLFLNYYDAHPPYPVQEEFIGEFWSGDHPEGEELESLEWLRARYDAEIRYADEHLGRLLEHMRQRGLYEDAWILVVADHGQLMGEMGMSGHGHSLSQHEIKVPLIVKQPGPERPRGFESTPVQQVDIFGTILTAAGLALPAGIQGATLANPDHPILAEVYPLPLMETDNKPWRQRGDWKIYVEGDWKFVWGGDGKHLLFDLGADPHERINMLQQEPERGRAMEEKLESYFASFPPPGAAPEVTPTVDDLRALRAVGYLDGDDESQEGAAPEGDRD